MLRTRKVNASERKQKNDITDKDINDCDGVNSTTNETMTDGPKIEDEDKGVRHVIIGNRLLKVRKVGVDEQKRRVGEPIDKDCSDDDDSNDLTVVVMNRKCESGSSDLEVGAQTKTVKAANDQDTEMFEGSIADLTDAPDMSRPYVG